MSIWRWLLLIACVMAAICFSMLLAHYGEPQSAWLYCDAIDLNICED